MAGHLPVEVTMFRLALLEEAKRELANVQKCFEKRTLSKFTKYQAMKLPINYAMDEEHGFIDDSIISVHRQEDILEFHLDKNQKINAIYLVM